MGSTTLLVLVVATALAFDFTNGFHGLVVVGTLGCAAAVAAGIIAMLHK